MQSIPELLLFLACMVLLLLVLNGVLRLLRLPLRLVRVALGWLSLLLMLFRLEPRLLPLLLSQIQLILVRP